MRRSIPALLSGALLFVSQACAHSTPTNAPPASATTTIVVVRHAEKSTDDPRDPSLSSAGQQRARDLADLLKDAGVSAFYVTQYKRTRHTAEPLAQKLAMPLVERPVSTANSATYAKDLAREVLSSSAGKTVLVVGHSNTVPQIVKAFSGHEIKAIQDPEYDHIFVIVVATGRVPQLFNLRFGTSTP